MKPESRIRPARAWYSTVPDLARQGRPFHSRIFRSRSRTLAPSFTGTSSHRHRQHLACYPPSSMQRVLFIVNPQSAGGSTGRRWAAEILSLVTARFPGARWVVTRAPGQAEALAARAQGEGADLLVAVGGDGTVHEVVNGILGDRQCEGDAALPQAEGPAWPDDAAREERKPLPVLGLLPLGTGCDLAKTLGIPTDLPKALDILAAGRTLLADVCEITCTSADGAPVRRFSINTSGCGLSGEVAARVNGARWPRHGLLAFLMATLRGVLAYRPRQVAVSLDGEPAAPTRILALFVCNGQYCGGGMRPGLSARIDDGVLRVVEVGALPLACVLVNLPKLYSGEVEGVKGVRVRDARRVEVSSDQQVLVDCDGEQPGRLPASYEVRPGALRLVASLPWV